MPDNWEERVSAVWSEASKLADAEVLAAIDALVAERHADDPVALFEAAGARDYIGLESKAEPLYRRALALGLDPERHARATIQLASTLRNLGSVDEAIVLLEDQLRRSPSDRWAAPAKAFLALALVSSGDERAAASLALTALADYLPAYGNSVRSYAADLRAT